MAGLAAALSITAFSSTAAINYGDFSDTPPGAVMYLDVTESSFSNALPLFGPPDITGDQLDFDPSAFGVSSSGGASGLADGQLNFRISTIPGAGLTGFSLIESGDFSFSGINPTPGSFVSASGGATVTILEIDGVALPNPINFFASNSFVTDFPTTGGAPSTGLLPWSLVTNVDLTNALGQFESGATLIEVAINNQLATGSTSGNQAAIAKKDFRVVATGNLDVPEPTSLALMGLGGLLLARRRRA